MTEIVPATPEMFVRFYGEPQKRTARAMAVVCGEEIIGIAGVASEAGTMVLFSELTDDLRRDKRSLVKLIRAVTPMMEGRTVYSIADPEIEGSDILLEHMGFTKCRDEVYQWQR